MIEDLLYYLLNSYVTQHIGTVNRPENGVTHELQTRFWLKEAQTAGFVKWKLTICLLYNNSDKFCYSSPIHSDILNLSSTWYIADPDD